MSWFIREEELDGGGVRPPVFDFPWKEGDNLCISGFVKSGKTTALLYFYKHIYNQQPNANILYLVYSNSIAELLKQTVSQLGFTLNISTFWKFSRNHSHYDYILCDDVHLMGQGLLKEICNSANHVIVTINPYLTFFERNTFNDDAPVTISQVKEILSPKVQELHSVHIGHDELAIDFAKFLLNMNIMHPKRDTSFTTYRQRVCIRNASTKSDEVISVVENAKECKNLSCSSAVLLPTRKSIISFVNLMIQSQGKNPWIEKTNRWGMLDLSDLNNYLSAIGIDFQFIGSGCGKLDNLENKTNILTYHGAVGFDFDYVYMPFLDSNIYLSNNETVSKSLFAFALTRSRSFLYLSYSGNIHPYLEIIRNNYNNNIFDNNPKIVKI